MKIAHDDGDITPYGLASRIVDTLERAHAADERGDAAAANSYREQAYALRAQLAVTPARTPADRVAHSSIAKHAALELVASLLLPTDERTLAGRARELLNLIERVRESGAAPSSRPRRL